MTYPMTLAATISFAVDVPRYRWELGVVDGVDCLVPHERLASARFTGDERVFDFMEHAAELDDEALLDFANRTSGLFVEDGVDPNPESLRLIRAESLAFERLWDLRNMRVPAIEYDRWARPGVVAPRRHPLPADAWVARSIETLRDLLPALRPDYGPLHRPSADEAHEGVALAWLDATARDHWAVGLPPDRWRTIPMARASAQLVPVDPVIRCRTMLGYAYAQLLVGFDLVRRKLEMIQERFPRDSPRPKCGRCGDALEPYDRVSGRKRRSDTRWCPLCRQLKNTELQRQRRQASSQASHNGRAMTRSP